MRRQHAIHQPLQPVGFLDDHLGVFAQLRLLELALEELCRPSQAAERILDLVREVADQLAVRLLLEHQALLARMAFEQQSKDRKSTRLNSSHPSISYAVFCLKKKKKKKKKKKAVDNTVS